MLRMFEQHKVRKQRELDGLWEFRTVSESGNEELGEIRRAIVPSCWETLRGLEDYRGRGVYSRDVTTESDTVRLIFKGVSHTADVYWDGKHVKKHYNAYTAFDIILKGVEPGEHNIMVIADNRFGVESALHVPNDYRSYGGITRPVAIEELQGMFISRVQAQPIFSTENGGWELNIRAVIKRTEEEQRASLRCTIAGRAFNLGEVPAGNSVTAECTVALDDIKEWSSESPVLYTLTAMLINEDGEITDDLAERVGFREVKLDGEKILLNGKRIYLKGFNRHEDYAQYGCAVPVQLMQYDLEIIRSTGANTIRTSHYPNDERFLDLCDEQGFFVWEEAHARGLSLEQIKNPNFIGQSADCIREMVEQHYTHPCIIMWGLLNECPSNERYGRSRYEEQLSQLRRLDPYRPLTFASDKHFDDLCLGLVDIISFNIYPKWYEERDIKALVSEIKYYAQTHGGASKPMIISEFGAGGVAGYNSFSNAKWSEGRQAEILRESIRELSEIPYISGLLIWQFADCRVDDEWSMTRPKTQNNKGIVDTFRTPKQAYYVVCEEFKEII